MHLRCCWTKASTVAKAELEAAGAMDYTIVVSATASDPAPLQFLAPYAGCSAGEFLEITVSTPLLFTMTFLNRLGLTERCHLFYVVLLEEKPTWRRLLFTLGLLERAAKLSDDLGGGSLTALPIIEILEGDVSTFVPTNVISITDGQILLKPEFILF